MKWSPLPMIGLRHHAYLTPPATDLRWSRQPRAVGIGADGQAVALWDEHVGDAGLLTRHGADGRSLDPVVLSGACRADFVQPLADGGVLLVNARIRGTGDNAEIWNADGVRVTTGHIGDAVEDVLVTSGGDIWVGYFDEAAASGRGLGGHGLVRFDPDLRPRWRYPLNSALPRIDDCQALNVNGETAYAFVYNANHLISVGGTHTVDHGEAPRGGVDGVLVDGERGILIGGYGADYDLVSPVRTDTDGLHVTGAPSRLVQPDGMEVRGMRWTCRGPQLHAFLGSAWYLASLDDFPAAT